MKQLLTLLALTAAALALAATASATNHTTVTETEHIHGAFTAPEFDVNPCTGAAITSFDADGNIVAHVTYFLEDGVPTEVWATFTETGMVTLTDANNVTYTGHFTAWGNFNLNERNTNNSFTLTFRAFGSDGSSLIIHETAHFTMNANGQITVSFDRPSSQLRLSNASWEPLPQPPPVVQGRAAASTSSLGGFDLRPFVWSDAASLGSDGT